MQVFLVGFMGSGKSSIGGKLATRLNCTFVDMDAALEAQEGMSVASIFELKGEAYFRQIERQWLLEQSSKNQVVALGGGAACLPEVMDHLRKIGVPIYLKVNKGILVSRLQDAKENRPMIEAFKHSEDELAKFVEEKLKEREPYYLRSKIIFNSSSLNATKLDLMADLASLSVA